MTQTRNPFKILGRNYIESSIKASLLESDFISLRAWLDIAHNHSGHIAATDNSHWLTFRFNNGESLADYALTKSNQLLQEYRDYPNRTPWYKRFWNAIRFKTPAATTLFPSQTYLKNLLLLESEFAKPYVQPKQSIWKRFINWYARSLSIGFDFNAPPITLETSAIKLYSDGIQQVEGPTTQSKVKKANFPSTAETFDQLARLSEHYTPAEVLKNPKLLQGRLGIKTTPSGAITPTRKKETTHMAHWLDQSPLTQAVSIDQVDQQMQIRQQYQQQTLSKVMLAPVQKQAKQYLDNSLTENLDSVIKSMKYDTIEQWLGNFSQELKNVHEDKNRFIIKISETAKKVLAGGEKFFTYSYQEDIDLEKLPLGFFIDRETDDRNNTTYILKFSRELREKQLKDDLAYFSLDPAATSDVQLKDQALDPQALKALQDQFYAELAKQEIEPDFEPLKIIIQSASRDPISDVDSSAGTGKKRYDTLLPSLYEQLNRVLVENGREHFLSLLVQLAKLNNISSNTYERWDMAYDFGGSTKPCSLLNNFLAAYFPDQHPIASLTGDELGQSETLQLLSDLSNKDNALAQQIFSALLNFDKPMTFNKAYQAAMIAQRHFVSLDLPLSEKTLKEIATSGLTYLKTIINFGGESRLPKLQTMLALSGDTPSNFVLCQRLLNQGYSFVADCMDLGRHSSFVKKKESGFGSDKWVDQRVPMIVDATYLNNIHERSYPDNSNGFNYIRNPYFVAWFRYLAYQVEPQYVEEAIAKWKSVMGEGSLAIKLDRYHIDKKNIENNWDKLKEYVLSLPKKMDIKKIEEAKIGLAEKDKKAGLVNQSAKEALVQDERKQREYNLDHAETLCQKTLKLNSKEAAVVLNALRELNILSEKYKSVSGEDLLKKASQLKTDTAYTPIQMIEALAVLRELNYRSTTFNSKREPPQGEWLRLEQVVTILLASSEPAKLFQIDTSEGKTLMIGLTAILHALQGRKTDVTTHNESFADESYDKIQTLAPLLNLEIADKKSSDEIKKSADILCIDISSAVTEDALHSYEGKGKREADVVLADEIDNQVDIHAKTTMQISDIASLDSQSQKELALFLVELNKAVILLSDNAQLSTPNEQVEFIKQNLKDPLAQNKFLQGETLPFWIAAMVRAQQMQKDKDFIIEDDRIRIVHHTTTGYVDRTSIWGAGVHQCVAAIQKAEHPDIVIEPLTDIVAEGNIATYYTNNYKTCFGFTGTVGDKDFCQKMTDIIGAKDTIVMPRAERPSPQGINWPLIADGKGGYQKQFNRTYRFAPIIKENDSEHRQTLVDMICKIRQENPSGIVFFNTIAECEEFYQFLQTSEGRGKVQIFDGTKQGESDDENEQLRISQNTAIRHAATPGMITLTTAAGGRGVDFHSVPVGIAATPSLWRVVNQKSGRVGRNGDFGLFYEVYSMDQLDETTKALFRATDVSADQTISIPEQPSSEKANLRFGLDEMEAKMQQSDLQQLDERKPLDEAKSAVQKEYQDSAKKSSHWGKFFSKISTESDVKSIKNAWESFKKLLR